MTNGEKIKEIFPQAKITPQYVDMMLIGYDVGIDGESFFSDEWWDAEYKEPTTKNDLGGDYISREAVERIINKWLSHSDYELKDHIYSMTEKIHNLP